MVVEQTTTTLKISEKVSGDNGSKISEKVSGDNGSKEWVVVALTARARARLRRRSGPLTDLPLTPVGEGMSNRIVRASGG